MVSKRRPFSDDAGACEPGADADAGRRLCAVARVPRDRSDLIRFVSDPDQILVPDLSAKLPGRGVWVSADRVSIEAAIKKKAFSRSLKAAVTIPENLSDHIEHLLEQSALQALAFANKAGQIVCGFDKSSAVIDRGEAKVMLHGRDAALGGRRKLDGKFKAISAELGIPAIIIDDFTIDQMSLAMGRSNVVHAALLAGGAARNAIDKTKRLTRYRQGIANAGDDGQGPTDKAELLQSGQVANENKALT
ncbi:MAG: RNA-binding protein [Pseudomonadota bacterium]